MCFVGFSRNGKFSTIPFPRIRKPSNLVNESDWDHFVKNERKVIQVISRILKRTSNRHWRKMVGTLNLVLLKWANNLQCEVKTLQYSSIVFFQLKNLFNFKCVSLYIYIFQCTNKTNFTNSSKTIENVKALLYLQYGIQNNQDMQSK